LRKDIKQKETRKSELEKEERVLNQSIAELQKRIENESFLKERVEEQLNRVKRAHSDAAEKNQQLEKEL
jgi:hypothetical protein